MASTTTITQVSDLVQAVEQTTDAWGAETWWRGHALSTWKLIPSVFRDPSAGPDYEKHVAIRFMQRARTRHEKCPDDSHLAPWLFFMQHYRLPTRLLDWTESALVAAYFAVADDSAESGVLWALDAYALNKSQIAIEGLVPSHHPEVQPLVMGILTGAKPERTPTVALITDEVDIRMMMQLSAFTIHGSPQALEEAVGHERFLTRFDIPGAAKPLLRLQLSLLGIRETSLFPDLEHLAHEIAHSRPEITAE